MERLVSSLLGDARLVLLGDAEQLPSVAAGAVFRDLGRAPGVPTVSLTTSHRMDPSLPEGSNILQVAARVNAGVMPDRVPPVDGARGLLPSRLDAVGVLDALPDDPDRLGGVFFFEPDGALARERFIDFWLTHRARGPRAIQALAEATWPRDGGRIADEASAELEPLFVHLERARLLCVTRSAARPTGVDAVNAALHRRFADARGAGTALLLPGEPVLVTKNDYKRALFNGDQGVVLFTEAAGEGLRPCAVFRSDDGFAAHPLEAVRGSIDLGFATTVHKAQGSEHDAVALLLPETDSPRLLTREIVYTAITRARRSVLVVGSPELFARAAARRVERETGIAERMGSA
jgi:exodeoxyribonuclease V alpha subunit